MANLILIRHGQSIWNLEKKFTGWVDVDLADKGKIEAQFAAKLIKKLNLNFHYCFTSLQKRAIKTLELILKELEEKNLKITKAWQLNERHYGKLTGLKKDEIKKIHGEEQVQIWRRSWDIKPPTMNTEDKNNPTNLDLYKDIPKNLLPVGESLKDTYDRVIPYFDEKILPLLKKNKNILISAHGNSLRSLYKKLFDISVKKISKIEVPTGNPLLINFKENLQIKSHKYLDEKRSRKILFDV